MKISEMIQTKVLIHLKLKKKKQEYLGHVIDFDKDAGRISCYLVKCNIDDVDKGEFFKHSFWLHEIEYIHTNTIGHVVPGDEIKLDDLYKLPPIRRPEFCIIKG